jgi:hypothetical protein
MIVGQNLVRLVFRQESSKAGGEFLGNGGLEEDDVGEL